MNIAAYMAKIRVTAVVFMTSALMACGVIYDQQGDCSVKYRIEFKYDRNMEFADAFEAKVPSVALYVFDSQSVLVHQQVAPAAELKDAGNAMVIELEPDRYTLLAWCGVDGSSFTVPTAVEGQTTLSQMQCTMARNSSGAGAYVDSDLSALYHGMMTLDYTDVAGVHTEVMSLTKNTNNFRIILQQTSSKGEVEAVDSSELEFTIVDSNGRMDYDNSLLEDEQIEYRPWSIVTGNVDVDTQSAVVRASDVQVTVAELTTARLMTDSRPLLVVTNRSNGNKVLSVPIVDYALLVKGNYNKAMDDQEYLDRQDEYNMTFFIHDGEWVSSQIIINSWRVVIDNKEL